jgi:hypothetical protein
MTERFLRFIDHRGIAANRDLVAARVKLPHEYKPLIAARRRKHCHISVGGTISENG